MIVKESGSDFVREEPDAGTYAGRCVRVVDLGTQINDYDKDDIKSQRQVRISWEISELMESGKPFAVADSFTLNIGDKANLGKILMSWRGRLFTDEEKAGFDLSTILGVPGLISVSYGATGWQKIKSVLQLPKGMTVTDQFNDSFLFDIEDIYDEDKLKALWGLERYSIAKSDEFVASGKTMPERPKEEDNPADNDQAATAF
jgi:hypothetical protein